jgi:hypothetical protein
VTVITLRDFIGLSSPENVSGAGRKASERERSGERDFRKKRGAGAERGAGDRGTGTERGAGYK